MERTRRASSGRAAPVRSFELGGPGLNPSEEIELVGGRLVHLGWDRVEIARQPETPAPLLPVALVSAGEDS